MKELIKELNTEKRMAAARYDRLVLYSRKLYLANGKTEKYSLFIDTLYENLAEYVNMIDAVKAIILSKGMECF